MERGNVLFLILIAVALFAALSYAVTKSTSGGGNASRETMTLESSQLLQYSSSVATAIMRMQINSSCDESQLNFSSSRWGHTDYDNAGAPSDNSCDIFHASGGGVQWDDGASSYSSSLGWEFLTPQIHGIGNTNDDALSSDLAVVLGGISQELCAAVNGQVGISGIPVDNGDVIDGALGRFDGDFAHNDNITGDVSGTDGCSDGVALCGVSTGCFREGGGGELYVFYHVLLAR